MDASIRFLDPLFITIHTFLTVMILINIPVIFPPLQCLSDLSLYLPLIYIRNCVDVLELLHLFHLFTIFILMLLFSTASFVSFILTTSSSKHHDYIRFLWVLSFFEVTPCSSRLLFLFKNHSVIGRLSYTMCRTSYGHKFFYFRYRLRKCLACTIIVLFIHQYLEAFHCTKFIQRVFMILLLFKEALLYRAIEVHLTSSTSCVSKNCFIIRNVLDHSSFMITY